MAEPRVPGSYAAAGPQRANVWFPAGALRPGRDNVVAVLAENPGHPEGPSSEQVGLYSAALTGSTATVTWRLMGNAGGTTLADPVRGPLNATGDGAGPDDRDIRVRVQAGVRGGGEQLATVGHGHGLLHRRDHAALHPRRRELLVPG
ncbi:MAG: hypothetical protein ACM3ML_27100 [Micromonosporaceae bacterium]